MPANVITDMARAVNEATLKGMIECERMPSTARDINCLNENLLSPFSRLARSVITVSVAPGKVLDRRLLLARSMAV